MKHVTRMQKCSVYEISARLAIMRGREIINYCNHSGITNHLCNVKIYYTAPPISHVQSHFHCEETERKSFFEGIARRDLLVYDRRSLFTLTRDGRVNDSNESVLAPPFDYTASDARTTYRYAQYIIWAKFIFSLSSSI